MDQVENGLDGIKILAWAETTKSGGILKGAINSPKHKKKALHIRESECF